MMMDISKMNESEKSKALARAMGWAHGNLGLMHDPDGWTIWGIEDGSNCTYGRGNYPSLYHPHNMALAWRVIRWANASPDAPMRMFDELEIYFSKYCYGETPEKAQQLWLDAALRILIAYGRVSVETAD